MSVELPDLNLHQHLRNNNYAWLKREVPHLEPFMPETNLAYYSTNKGYKFAFVV
jgi:hypothetical protein